MNKTAKALFAGALLMAVIFVCIAANPSFQNFDGSQFTAVAANAQVSIKSSATVSNLTSSGTMTVQTNSVGEPNGVGIYFPDYVSLQIGGNGNPNNAGWNAFWNPAHSGHWEFQTASQGSWSIIFGQDQQGLSVLQLGGEGGIDGHIYIASDVPTASTRNLGYSQMFSMAAPYYNGTPQPSSRAAYGQIGWRGEALDTNDLASSFQWQSYSVTNFNPNTNQSPGTVAGLTVYGDGVRLNGKIFQALAPDKLLSTYNISFDNLSVVEITMLTNFTVTMLTGNLHTNANQVAGQEIDFYPGAYNRTLTWSGAATNISFFSAGVPIPPPTTVYAGSVLKVYVQQEVGQMTNFHASVSVPFYPPLDPDAGTFLTNSGIGTVQIGSPVTYNPYAYNVNSYVWALKNAGLWPKIVEEFPCIGATVQSVTNGIKHSFGGILNGNYKLTANGVQGDGTSAYFNSTIAPSSAISSQNSMALGFNLVATNVNLTNGQYFAGVTDGGAGHVAAITTDTAGMYPFGLNNNNVDNPVIPTSAGWLGIYVVNRTASTAQIIYQNYGNTRTSTTTPTTGLTGGTGGIYFGAEGFNNGGSSTPLAYCSSTLNNFLVAQNFTDTDVSNYTYATAAFSANATALPTNIVGNTVLPNNVVINGGLTVNGGSTTINQFNNLTVTNGFNSITNNHISLSTYRLKLTGQSGSIGSTALYTNTSGHDGEYQVNGFMIFTHTGGGTTTTGLTWNDEAGIQTTNFNGATGLSFGASPNNGVSVTVPLIPMCIHTTNNGVISYFTTVGGTVGSLQYTVIYDVEQLW